MFSGNIVVNGKEKKWKCNSHYWYKDTLLRNCRFYHTSTWICHRCTHWCMAKPIQYCKVKKKKEKKKSVPFKRKKKKEIVDFRVSKNEEMKQLSFINLETSYFSDARRLNGEKEGSQNIIICDRQSYVKHTNTFFQREYSRSGRSSFLHFIHLFI